MFDIIDARCKHEVHLQKFRIKIFYTIKITDMATALNFKVIYDAFNFPLGPFDR